MAILQLRIYAPAGAPYDNHWWAETMLARVIKPIIESLELPWFWILRYTSTTPDYADSDASKVPCGFFVSGSWRSIRFRCCCRDEMVPELQRHATELISQENCWAADWIEYPALAELGGDRFLGDNGEQVPSQRRANLVAAFLCATARLTIDALKPADGEGRFCFETNHHQENPHGSSFESLHHLFCNATCVPTTVLVCRSGSQDLVRTHWQPQPPGFQQVAELPVKF